MATIVYQLDKRSGITYAYESVSYWDKEKKQSRAKRTLIGRVDKETKEIVSTDGRCKKSKQDVAIDVTEVSRRAYYGATYLLDKIGEKLGLIDDLKVCFGEKYKQILSIAYYLILEDNNPLMRFEKWGNTHKHPFGKDITSQRSSELFALISENDKMKFFDLQGKRKIDKEFFAYDTTSISSYSKTLKQVQYGHNKEDDTLAQINLAVVFGEKSNLPFYYRKLSGNIPDCKTVNKLLDDLEILGFHNVHLVMDRGFYSKENIDSLFQAQQTFLLSTSMRLKFIQDSLKPLYSDFASPQNYNPTYGLYTQTVKKTWGKDKKPLFVHYYYNSHKAANESVSLDTKIIEIKTQIEQTQNSKECIPSYLKYFTIENIDGTLKVSINNDMVSKTKQTYGYFTLITNKDDLNSIQALEIYRNKDVVEKAFGNLKERLNMRRTLVSSEQSLDGKLFVEFIALIYLSYIKKQMQVNNMFKDYTIQTLLDKLDVIECFEYKNNTLKVGEILQKQKDIYSNLGIEIPSSL